MWDRCAKWDSTHVQYRIWWKTPLKSFLTVGKSLLNTQTHSYDKTMFFIVLQEDRSSQTMEESLLKC